MTDKQLAALLRQIARTIEYEINRLGSDIVPKTIITPPARFRSVGNGVDPGTE